MAVKQISLEEEYNKKTGITPEDIKKLRYWLNILFLLRAMAVKQISLEEEYNKKTGITPEDIKKLRYWLNIQPHLPKDHITDLDLILAYHSCNRSHEVTKQVLDLHYTLRTLFTNFFKDRVLDEAMERNLNTVLIQPLTTRSKEGDAVIYFKLLDPDPKKYVFSLTVRCVMMIMDLWQFEEGTWPGYIMVCDMEGMRLGHLAKLDPQSLQQFLYFLQEAMLVKITGLHMLNAPSFIDKFMMIVKPFLKKELLDMLKIHQVGAHTIDKYLPREAFPKEAGGEFKTLNELRDETIAKLKANKDFFVAESNKRVVESLRPGKPKTISDIFGSVEGSFKKLEID